MSPPPRRIRFYFDYISSNAYLAWAELPKLAARHGAGVEPVPVLFAGLLEAHGQLGPAELPSKALWMWKNNLRKAARLGLPLRAPVHHPFNPLLPLRVSSLPLADAERAALIDSLFGAIWVDGRHASDPEVVADAAKQAGLDGPRLVEQAGTPEAKERLRAQTHEAIANGVFGVPSMRVGDELFWGYDDFPWLDLFLDGEDPLARDWMDRGPRPTPSSVRRRFRSSG